MAIAARKLTYADFVRIPDDGSRHEIIEGEEFVTPSPAVDHQTVVGKLFRLLSDHVEARNLGRVFISPTDVLLSRHDVVQPDLFFVSRKRARIVRRKNISGAPDLVIEVTSPTTAGVDRGRKRTVYSKTGAREYWIVDLFAQVIEIHEFGRTRRTTIHREGRTFGSKVLPDFSLDVEALFSVSR